MSFSLNFKQLPQYYNNLIQQVFSRLSIQKKIICGYGLVLGIGVLGIAIGLVVGNNYFQQTREQMTIADDEAGLLSSMQGILLELQCRQQQMILSSDQSQSFQQKISQLKAAVTEAEEMLSQLQEFSQTNAEHDLQAFLTKYEQILAAYFQQFKILLQQISNTHSQQKLQLWRQLIAQFNQSPAALGFYQFSEDLNDFAKTLRAEQEKADLAQNQATLLQAQIIIGSILLSTAIAAVVAICTSKIIVRPLQALTRFAQEVIHQGNFELQAPVTATDEVGTLAVSINELIRQVRHLLAEQKAEVEARLIQSEKLSSLGRMIAGLAHEINNPINFIYGNLGSAKTYINDLFDLIETYKAEIPKLPAAVKAKEEQIELEFIQEDLPKLLKSLEFGAERTRDIVRSLKDFSRLDGSEPQLVNLHACIDSTLLILQHRLKKSIKVIRNYGDIPAVPGYAGLLYQVFMNIFSNAIDALEEKSATSALFSPTITINTARNEEGWVTIKIADNGSGIAKEHQDKIFETFFTTKPRGIGTGLGLAISYQIIVEKHGGKLTYNSEVNSGTEFTIALPITQNKS